MTNLLEQGSDWLEAMRHRHATVEVVYAREAESVVVQASIGRTVFEVDTGRGVLEKFESRDFLIRAEDLVLDAARTLPERGDTIRWALPPDSPGGGAAGNSKVHVFEVMAPGKEPHYRYSDPFRKTLRVHTKLVGTEPPAPRGGKGPKNGGAP